MTTILKPLLGFIKFGLFHFLIIPLLLTSMDANKILSQVDRVSANELNVRVDSTSTAPAIGYVKKGMALDVKYYGQDWIELEGSQKYYLNMSREDANALKTGHAFVSKQYVEKAYPRITGPYITFIIVLQILSLLFLLFASGREFLITLWNQIFSTSTIPIAVKLLVQLIFGVGKETEES